MSHEPRTRSTNPEGDIAFVAWLARWAFLTALLIILFDLAVFRNYPFPDALDRFRAAFYTLYGGVVLLASIVFAFLGYRVVTTGYQVRKRDLYLLFLPAVLLVTSLVWLLLLARAG